MVKWRLLLSLKLKELKTKLTSQIISIRRKGMNINLEKSKLEPSFDDFIKRYQKEDIEILDLRDKIFEDKRKKL